MKLRRVRMFDFDMGLSYRFAPYSIHLRRNKETGIKESLPPQKPYRP